MQRTCHYLPLLSTLAGGSFILVGFFLPVVISFAPPTSTARGVVAQMSHFFPRFSPALARWKWRLVLVGAMLEWLMMLSLLILSGLSGAENYPGIGFALPLLGFVLLLVGT